MINSQYLVWSLILIPSLAGVFSFFIKNNSLRRLLLVVTAFLHLVLILTYCGVNVLPDDSRWFYLDKLGAFFLLIVSLLFFSTAIYGVHYLKGENNRMPNAEETFVFRELPEALFTGCLLLFLAAMTITAASQHLGILWIAMEATTLITTPLICYHRDGKSLEAAWKYLLICSVGIALALLGNLLLVVANPHDGAPFTVSQWIKDGPLLNREWLKASFLFFFVGYGTKMGLTPFHTWLPDAHSEAPSMISALLSGALLNCAFLCILRIYQVCRAAELLEFVQSIFLFFGILTILFSALFLLKQVDFKRMLAYSSIEHMGILALGIGIGGQAIFGSLFHAFNHSLTKSVLFLAAGNILTKYGTKTISDVTGVSKTLPWTSALWICGFFSITGMPPFATFLSKFIILKAAFNQGNAVVASFVLFLLTIIFMSMAKIFLSMFLKKEHTEIPPDGHEPLARVLIPTLFVIIVLILGTVPCPLMERLFNEMTLLLSRP